MFILVSYLLFKYNVLEKKRTNVPAFSPSAMYKATGTSPPLKHLYPVPLVNKASAITKQNKTTVNI